MPATERYRGLAEQAGRLAGSARTLIKEGAYRSAAKVLGDASLLLGQAADERDVAFGRAPGDVLRGQLAACPEVQSKRSAAE